MINLNLPCLILVCDVSIHRFDATKMLELMRGKRLLYVGDSINRNQFESMVCMLMGDIRDPNRPRISHAKGTYSFYFVVILSLYIVDHFVSG